MCKIQKKSAIIKGFLSQEYLSGGRKLLLLIILIFVPDKKGNGVLPFPTASPELMTPD